MTLTFSPLQSSDLDQIWQIEQQAHSHPWARKSIDDLQSRGACHWLLRRDNHIVGYYYAQNIVGEVSLLNIAVDPKCQGQGLGKQLLQHLLEQCQSLGAESIWLEVRASNNAAYQMYLQAGFNEVDRRIGYYPADNGREDAIIMSYFLF
ncbi:ribosomal protein S18-alanine N-acetyltransferase [Vibrio sp.]|uniref:ribosomal protein S18-alanine N-acetyltransferase n=1 Tax=Vibrio sp. TaxID=678 RepID=UPI003D0BA43F